MIRKLHLLALLAAGIAPASAKHYWAPRYDVDVAVERGGNLWITESFTFAFSGGPYRQVWRDLPTAKCDGILDIEATPPASVAARGKSIRVTWNFDPVSDVERTFLLRYRVMHAITSAPDGDSLVWKMLPVDRSYRIGRSQVLLHNPPGVTFLDQPKLDGRPANEADWTAGRFEVSDLSPGRTALLRATWSAGKLTVSRHGWQRRDEERSAMIARALPAAAGLCLLIAIAGILAAVGIKGKANREEPAAIEGIWTQPPSGLPPVLAAYLVSPTYASSVTAAMATVMDLGARGCVSVETAPKQRWSSRDFLVLRRADCAPRNAFEVKVLELLFGATARERKLSEFASRCNSRPGELSKARAEDLKAAGFLDPEREALRRNASHWAILALLLGFSLTLAGALVAAVKAESIPVLVVGAGIGLLIAGIAIAVGGSAVSPLSPSGAIAAAQWKSFAAYLKSVAKGREGPPDATALDRLLPYAAALGLAAPWVRRMGRDDQAALPAWFEMADGADAGSFVAMMAAADSSGVSGGDGGGAGGGGGSGAA